MQSRRPADDGLTGREGWEGKKESGVGGGTKYTGFQTRASENSENSEENQEEDCDLMNW